MTKSLPEVFLNKQRRNAASGPVHPKALDRRLPPRRATDAGAAEGRTEPRGQGSRPQRAASGAAGAGGRGEPWSDSVAGAGRVTARSLDATPSASRPGGHSTAFGGERRRVGDISTPLPTRAWPRAGPVTPTPLRS